MELRGPRAYLLALWLGGLALCIQGSPGAQDPGEHPLELKDVFAQFQARYNRSYANAAEHTRRLDIFARNLARAQKLQEAALGTAKFGVTPFSDLTEEEFGHLYGQPKPTAGIPNFNTKVVATEWGASVPLSCDWKKAGVISPIRSQGQYQCCWAIAAAGNIEALWNIAGGEKVQVSVQELIDCDRCKEEKSGYVWDAFLTVLREGGLASEQDYPFQGDHERYKCQATKYRKVAWIHDFTMVPRDEQVMAGYLAAHGPITVLINSKLLQHYKSGVIKASDSDCDPQQLNHWVLLVGFGSVRDPEGTAYWLVKNSWGHHWGEKGYFRLHRGSNTCGVTKFPFTALVKAPNGKRPGPCPA
ncbi:cathepsin W [Suncus etruscus]|uniref:cathepsin W n=1 Tax=Suncus etruscus TaxID=109475 RepID=UPI00210FE39E|nr:cathepsin W [Suncus etruscus]